MHEGTIWVESECSKGSKFYVNLPCRENFTSGMKDGSFNNVMPHLSERIRIELSDLDDVVL